VATGIRETKDMTDDNTLRGRVMRMPQLHGQLPDHGPIHFVSDAGEEYLLIAKGSETPGDVDALSAETAGQFEPLLDQDATVSGDIYGSVIWNAVVANLD
jgi:hypothetical protein